MKNVLSRREWIKCGFAGLALSAGHRAFSAVPQVSTTPVQAAKNVDLVLVNGKFVDGRGVIGSALTIQNGRILNAGQAMPLGPGVKTIDLRGRTVVPGFFDAHVHYTRAAMNPG
jgi:adenine deaminase